MPATQHHGDKPDVLIPPAAHTHKVDKQYRNTPQGRLTVPPGDVRPRRRKLREAGGCTIAGTTGHIFACGGRPPVTRLTDIPAQVHLASLPGPVPPDSR